jgi:hypothetical protein
MPLVPAQRSRANRQAGYVVWHPDLSGTCAATPQAQFVSDDIGDLTTWFDHPRAAVLQERSEKGGGRGKHRAVGEE